MDDRTLIADLENLASTGGDSRAAEEALDLVQQWELGLWQGVHRGRANKLLARGNPRVSSPSILAARSLGRQARRSALRLLNNLARHQRGPAKYWNKPLIDEILRRPELPKFLESQVLKILDNHRQHFSELPPEVQLWVLATRPDFGTSTKVSPLHPIASPTKVLPAPGHTVSTVAMAGETEDPLRNLCRSIKQAHGVMWHDTRAKGGNLLIEYLCEDDQDAKKLQQAGFRFSAGRGWWRK